MVYLDETGVDKYLYREHCYAPKGQTVMERIPGRRFVRKSLVAGQRKEEILAPLMYEGTMDSELFEHWFEHMLLPATAPDDVIILDNASFHRKKRLNNICEKHGRKIVFLPPYSPELNPIEKTWARIKKLLRSVMHKFGTLEDGLCYIFDLI